MLGKRGMRACPPRRRPQTTLAGILRVGVAAFRAGRMGRVIDYRKIQLDPSCAMSHSDSLQTLDADAVLDYGADIVVIATGSHWASDGATMAPAAPPCQERP